MFHRLHEKRVQKREQKRISEEKKDTVHYLHEAALFGWQDKVIELLNKCHHDPAVFNLPKRAKYGDTMQNGATPLITAARQGHAAVVRVFIQEPLLDLKAVDHLPPCVESMTRGLRSFHPSWHTEKDYWGNNALHAAAVTKHVDIVELLAPLPGMEVNAKCDSGKTPLMLVVEYCPRALPALLKVEGIDVNAQDENNRCALHLACLRRNPHEGVLPAYIQQLLDVPGIDLNLKDAQGWTPLMYAVKRGDAPVVDALMHAGADASIMNEVGCTAEAVAVLFGKQSLLGLLRSKPAAPAIRM